MAHRLMGFLHIHIIVSSGTETLPQPDFPFGEGGAGSIARPYENVYDRYILPVVIHSGAEDCGWKHRFSPIEDSAKCLSREPQFTD